MTTVALSSARGPVTGGSGPRCGTPSGYVLHYRHGGKPCDACRAAHSAYKREWRRTRRLLGLGRS